jgi:hypothetical protein
MRYALALAAIVAGLASWVGLIYLFRYSRISLLENLTFWISHFAFTGWLLALVLMFVWWKVLNIAAAHWFGPTPGGPI